MAQYSALPDQQNNKRNGRGKILPIGSFLILLVLTIWRLRHDLPTFVTSAVVEAPTAAPRKNIKPKKVKQQRTIKSIRNEFKKVCSRNHTGVKTRQEVRDLVNGHLAQFYVPPAKVKQFDKNKDPVEPCMYSFLDLGANIGDSLGKFIDAGIPMNCSALRLLGRRARYSLDHGNVTLQEPAGNDLTNFAVRSFQEVSRGPEDYCYVGIEGNPVFTSRLQQLEARVKATKPKPVRAAHFYTETVAAGKDAPTFLYLDQHSDKQNFWGSSIVATHVDAKREFVKQGNRTVKASVMGLKLSTLLKRSVKKTKGAHVIMKIDIEGGEYPVMNEAAGTICDYANAGVRVDLILETHNEKVLGGKNPDMVKYFKETKQKLIDCKVRLGGLSGAGGQR